MDYHYGNPQYDNPFPGDNLLLKLYSGQMLPYTTEFCNDRWVADKIMKEIRSRPTFSTDRPNFSANNPILINAQTGSGKTTFVLEHLAPYAKEIGYNVLFLSNRKALNQQQKNDFTQSLPCPKLDLSPSKALTGSITRG